VFFPTCNWIIAIWLFTFIVIVLISKCDSITMATIGYGITLIVILGFLGFSFYHIDFLRSGVIFSNWPTLGIGGFQHLFTDILEYMFHRHNFVVRNSKKHLWYNWLCGYFNLWYSYPTCIPLWFFLLN
jgi:hypothetical protein